MAMRVPVSSKGERNERRDKRFRFADSDFCTISVEIENGRRLFYRMGLHSGAFERCDESGAGDLVITAYRDDWRGPTGGRSLSDKAGASLIARETDVLEPLTVINASRKGVVYATRKTRALEYAWDQAPLIAVLDGMMDAGVKRPSVAGVVFWDLDLVVLYLFTQHGLVADREMQVSINPNSAASAAASFASMHHLPPDVETRLFTQEELGRALRIQQTPVYPRHATLFGLPYHQAITLVAAGVWTITVATGGWAGYEYLRQQRVEGEIASIAGQAMDAASRTGDELSRRLRSLARLASLDVSRGFETAEALWPPGGGVSMSLTPTEHKYDALIPVRVQKERENSALEVASLERTAKSLATPIPEGCGQASTGITGGMNDIKKSITCPRAVGGVAHGW